MEQVYIDVEEMLRRMRGNKKTVATMLGMFLEGEELKQLDDDLNNKDHAAAELSSHGVKGMVGTLSMPILHQAAAKLNAELKAGSPNDDTVAEYRAALEKTLVEAERVLAGLKEQE
ncbi:MAG TPA: hypothetical protein DEB31_06395 [Clostridiales bacterium]|nr:hypothetical protein [Clostridiales bacterium]